MSANTTNAFQSTSHNPAKVASPSNDLADTINQLKLDPPASGGTATPDRASSTDDKSVAQTNTDKTDKPNKVKPDKTTSPKKAAKKATKSSRSTPKQGSLLPEPSMTIDEAIAAEMPVDNLDVLVKEWSKYNEQQALLRAKAASEALANSVEARRQAGFDKILALMDKLGLTRSEVRTYLATPEAQRRGKSK